jgi:hypothetical protein
LTRGRDRSPARDCCRGRFFVHHTRNFNVIRVLSGLGLVVALGGCSSKPDAPAAPPKSDALQEVGGLIGAYAGEFKKGPTKVADLARYENGFPLGYQAVKSGDVVVVWGAKIVIEEGSGPVGGTDVVAYEKQVPTEGGAVLLQNNTVKQMTAAEFQAAPKAK